MNLIDDTLALIKQAQGVPVSDSLNKAFTQATGLVQFNLERPAKLIYPVITPLRNKIPRVKTVGGTAVNWRAITGIDTLLQTGGVPEGRRNAAISTTLKSYMAAFKTLGLEDYATFEAQYAAEGFDDTMARMIEGLLRSTMIMEENTLLGGNTSKFFGVTPQPTLAFIASGGSIPNATDVYVSVVYLTHNGFRTGSVAGGVRGLVTTTPVVGAAYTNGGYSAGISVNQNGTTVAGSSRVTGTVPALSGVMAYAWFWGPTAGAGQKLGAITTINSINITTAVGTGTQTAADANLSGDHSTNAYEYDGIISLIAGAGQENPAAAVSGALINIQATGTPGVGTPLTTDGSGGIAEIETDLKSFWDNFRLSPSIILVNSQELLNITNKVISNGATPLFRFNLDAARPDSDAGMAGGRLSAGTVIGTYLNKYTMDGGSLVKVLLHPNVVPGTIVYYSERLMYPLSNVVNPLQLGLRREYYQIDWPLRERQYEKGVYVDGVLQMYFPPAFGIRTNIANG